MRRINQKRTVNTWWDDAYTAQQAQRWSIWKSEAIAKAAIASLPSEGNVLLPACGAAHCARQVHKARPQLRWFLSDYCSAGLLAGLNTARFHRIPLVGDECQQLVADVESVKLWLAAPDCQVLILSEVLEHLEEPLKMRNVFNLFDRVILTLPVDEKYIGPATTWLFEPGDELELLHFGPDWTLLSSATIEGVLFAVGGRTA